MVNGHRACAPAFPIDRDALLERVEHALSLMSNALVKSGFSDYEAGIVNMATRFAITGIVKERRDGRSEPR